VLEIALNEFDHRVPTPTTTTVFVRPCLFLFSKQISAQVHKSDKLDPCICDNGSK